MSEVKRVLVAMSGGVDSSVAAALLHEAGHDLIGVTLHLWDADGEQQVGRCCAPEDRDDARRTCEHLGIPHYVLDEREAFRKHVVDPFVTEYQAGRTPIPCVSCNRTVKLTYLADVARRFNATHIATGHYARLKRATDGQLRLLRGRDDDKDQSYFLFGLPQSTLETLVFPLGELTKSEVREAGRRLGVPNADKPESMELCFVPDGRVGDFIHREGIPRPLAISSIPPEPCWAVTRAWPTSPAVSGVGSALEAAAPGTSFGSCPIRRRSSWVTSPSSTTSSSSRPTPTGSEAALQTLCGARFVFDIGTAARSRTSRPWATGSRCASTSLSERLRLARPQWYIVETR